MSLFVKSPEVNAFPRGPSLENKIEDVLILMADLWLDAVCA